MVNNKRQSFFFRKPIAAGVVAFLFLMLLTQSLTLQRYLLNLSQSEKENTEELNRVVDQLQFNLNFALSATKTLAFIVEHYGVPKEFDSISKKLIESSTAIDAIQLLEYGIITKMYPLEGNEVVIGYNVVADPLRGTEVLIAAEKGEMYFGGPFELRQGGMGIVGRMPIVSETDSLAFAAVVIRLEKLLEVSGITNEDERFSYQLSKINPDSNEREYFIESDIDFTESQVANLIVPLGEWQIYVKEKQGNYYEGLLPLALLGFMMSLVGGSLTFFLLRRPSELEKQVNKQSMIILENQRRFQALVENSLDSVAILGPDGSNRYVSPSVTSVLGYSEEEIMKINLFDILHDDDKPFVAEEMQYVVQNPGISIRGHISRIKHKDGSWRWIEASITNLLNDPAVNGIVDNFRDITEKKEAEDIILKEKELSEAIINSLPGIFYLFNAEGEFLLWNTNFETVSEYSAAEIAKMTPESFFEGDDIAHIKEKIEETFDKGESFAEAYFVTKSKKKIYHFFTGKVIEYKGQHCVLGTGVDTSKRREAELELKRSEEQLLSIFNNSISAVILMDVEGNIKSWNTTSEEMFGWKESEVIDKPMHNFIMPSQHIESHLKGMKHHLKTGEGPILNSNIEITAINKDKKEFDISLGVTKVQIRGKEFFIGFINDISDRKRAERIKDFEDQKREAMINSTSDLIWSVSDSMTLIAANKSFKASFKKYTGVEITEGDPVLPKENLDKDYLLFWENLYKRALNGEQFTYENTVPANKNQPEQTQETNFNPIIVNGKIIGVACSSRNISDRIKSQKEIKEYNEKLQTAQEIAQLGYWEYVLGEKEVYWSNQVYEIWEEDPNTFELNLETFFESVHPDDRDLFNLYKNKPVDNLNTQDIEYRIFTRNGTLKWIHQYGKKIVEERLDKITFKGTLRDITVTKLQQEAIEEYNLKLQTAQKIAKLGYWEFDYKNDKLSWSDQVYSIWELPKKSFEVSFENFFETIHPEDKELFSLHQQMALNGVKPLEIEHRILLKNGKIKWVLERGKLIKDSNGEPYLFEGTVQDITGQKQIEIELRQQNYFIKTALDNLPIGIAVNNINTGEATLINKKFIQIYGWPKKELVNIDNFFKKVYTDVKYREEMSSQILSDIKSRNPKRMNWEGVKITTKKGEKKIINAKNIPLYDQGLMISTVLDVTEKALAEQQLATSNERYEYVTKATFDAVWDWDLAQDSIFWGDGFGTIFGYKLNQTNPDFWYKKIHPDDVEKIKTSIKNKIESFELNWEEEYRFKHENGTYRYVKDRGIVLRNVERKAIRIIGAMQDITSQKEYEQKLLDVNQKLRNLSAHLQEAREEERIAIAREIHDELGQQLTGIKLDVSWLKNRLDSTFPENRERTQRLIENINKTINDVRKIASHLRPGVLDDLGLEAAIEWQTQQFEDQTGLNCELKFESNNANFGKEINTALYRIYQETLTNIMRHAKATKVFTHLYVKDNTLVLKIKDNGIGISDSEKNNTFSLGITGMRERALMINGTLIIKKHKEGGTLVEVTIPFN